MQGRDKILNIVVGIVLTRKRCGRENEGETHAYISEKVFQGKDCGVQESWPPLEPFK